MMDKKIGEEASGPSFHLLVHHFLVEVFWRLFVHEVG